MLKLKETKTIMRNRLVGDCVANEEISAIVERLVETITPEKIYLFGSYARGDYNADSDYDFYVIVSDEITDCITLSQLAYRSIGGINQRSVDIMVNTKSRFENRCMRKTFERIVAREGLVIYEK